MCATKPWDVYAWWVSGCEARVRTSPAGGARQGGRSGDEMCAWVNPGGLMHGACAGVFTFTARNIVILKGL